MAKKVQMLLWTPEFGAELVSDLGVNLWNDYDSGDLKARKKPAPTYIYVEKVGLPKEVSREILELVKDKAEEFLENSDMPKFSMKLVKQKDRYVLNVKMLYYDTRLALVKYLRKEKLSWNGIKLDIISES